MVLFPLILLFFSLHTVLPGNFNPHLLPTGGDLDPAVPVGAQQRRHFHRKWRMVRLLRRRRLYHDLRIWRLVPISGGDAEQRKLRLQVGDPIGGVRR
jgi:hypothetical protein